MTPSRVVWGGSVTVIGRVAGTAVGGTRVALERQDFPFSAAFSQVGDTRTANSDGSFRFELARAVRDHPRARRHARRRPSLSSAIRTASSAVKVGATARTTSRRRRAHRRADLAAGAPPAACRCRSARRGGAGRPSAARAARPLDANRSRYRFSVKRQKRAGRYRVVVLARDGGAHVPGRSREVRVRALPKKKRR